MTRLRFLLVVLIFTALAVPAVLYNFAGAGFVFHSAAAGVHEFAFRKMFVFQGLERLSEQEVSALLPQERSILWWLWHRRQIEEQAARHPLVEQLHVANCGVFAWGCFVIQLSERKPRMLAMLSDKLWLVGEDGGYVKPVTPGAVDQPPGSGAAGEELPLIKGMLEPGVSADEARLRYQYVNKALGVIEGETGMKVSELRLKDNGELTVDFRSGPSEVTFDVPDGDYGAVREQARRLLAVLAELKGRSENVVAIDLAYKELAVVRTREGSPESVSNGTGAATRVNGHSSGRGK
jgi:hypothetical protein